MPPATRTTRRSTRSRKGSPTASNEEVEAKNASQIASDSILRNPSSGSGSDGDQADTLSSKRRTNKGNRSVTFSLGDNQSSPTSPNASETSLVPVKGSDADTAISARAKRSRRRQAANNDKDPVAKKGSAIKKGSSKKIMEANLKKDYAKGNASSSKASTKKGSGEEDEEVVKVKLNTGTLYLYKGLNRRAVFVRRV